jgi:hypothetical protein
LGSLTSLVYWKKHVGLLKIIVIYNCKKLCNIDTWTAQHIFGVDVGLQAAATEDVLTWENLPKRLYNFRGK